MATEQRMPQETTMFHVDLSCEGMLKNRRHEDKHALHHQVYAASTTSDPCDGEKRAHSCTQRDTRPFRLCHGHVIRTLCKCKPNMKNTCVYNCCSMSARVSHVSTLHDCRRHSHAHATSATFYRLYRHHRRHVASGSRPFIRPTRRSSKTM